LAGTCSNAEGCAWNDDSMPDKLIIESDREDDGRWISEVPTLPGTMAYGQSRDEAIARVQALALRVLADRLENGEAVPEVAQR
jgi:predicted RNase H-like HicB family nuclease